MKQAYARLCWAVGGLLIAVGAVLFLSFLRSLAPGAAQALPFPLGPNGYYFVAFAGSALVAWGGCLFAAARGPAGRTIGTATAIGLTLAAAQRILVWFLGDFAWAGELLRYEATLLLLLALAFVWLRPATREGEPRWGGLAGSAAISLLLALNLALPYTPLGRRGSEAALRLDAPSAVGRAGEPLPDLALHELDGTPLRLSDLRGQRVVLTFERSVDW